MEAIIKSTESGISTTMHLNNLSIEETAHTTESIYVECTTEDGVRFTLRLSQKEAEAIGTEAIRKDNEDYDRYRAELGKQYEMQLAREEFLRKARPNLKEGVQ